MKEVDDERIRFYLRHRALIDQWARIKVELPAVCGKFFWSLQDDIEERFLLDETIQLYREEEGNTPKLFVYRKSWLPPEQPTSVENPRPLVGIGIEWQRKRADFGKGTAYVGIWNDQRSPLKRSLVQELTTIADRVAKSQRRNATPWWTERTFVEPPNNESYWENLSPFRNLILEEIGSYWNRYDADIAASLTKAHELLNRSVNHT